MTLNSFSNQTASEVFAAIMGPGDMWHELDAFQDAMGTKLSTEEMVVGSIGTLSSSLVVGYVIWVVRSGLLLSSVVASMPAWTLIDPTVIMTVSDGDDEEDGESLSRHRPRCPDERCGGAGRAFVIHEKAQRMKILSPHTRIAAGLSGAVVAILCCASLIGLLPNMEDSEARARAELCETTALTSSALLVRGDFQGMSQILAALVDRNPDILSIGVRRPDGRLFSSTGEHEADWLPLANGKSTAEQMQVPLYRSGTDKWGTIEVHFRPLRGPGWYGRLRSRPVLLMSGMSSAVLSALLVHFAVGAQAPGPLQSRAASSSRRAR